LCHSFDNTFWILFIMRFNAVIAAYILAVTVSGAALPVAEDATTEVSAPESTEDVATDYPLFDIDEEDIEFLKRDAAPEADAEAEAGYRPYGLPSGKRIADAEPWKYRPYGMPSGKRSADAEPWKYRPYGMPSGKRSADAEPWKYRPYGMPSGKRSADADADAEAGYRPYGRPSGKREE
jgi:mating pheromone alpha-factor